MHNHGIHWIADRSLKIQTLSLIFQCKSRLSHYHGQILNYAELGRSFGDEDLYFWHTHAGAELDLFWQAGGKSWGMEFKYEDAPRLTRSMKAAFEDLSLERLWVIYPGNTAYRLAEKVQVMPLADISDTWRYE